MRRAPKYIDTEEKKQADGSLFANTLSQGLADSDLQHTGNNGQSLRGSVTSQRVSPFTVAGLFSHTSQNGGPAPRCQLQCGKAPQRTHSKKDFGSDGLHSTHTGCMPSSKLKRPFSGLHFHKVIRSQPMSHLFNMFVKQVANHCDTSTMPDCNKVLLVYGLTNLAKMEDESLDQMDPYQRGATDIIWESMMKGSYKTSGKNEKEPAEYYIDPMEPGNGGNQLGSQEEASTNVEEYAGPNRPIMGPMVVRVLPDGRPVPEDAQRPLPKDEDAEEFFAMRSKPVPSLTDFENHRQHRIPVKNNREHVPSKFSSS